jgi:hypothetical protein
VLWSWNEMRDSVCLGDEKNCAIFCFMQACLSLPVNTLADAVEQRGRSPGDVPVLIRWWYLVLLFQECACQCFGRHAKCMPAG